MDETRKKKRSRRREFVIVAIETNKKNRRLSSTEGRRCLSNLDSDLFLFFFGFSSFSLRTRQGAFQQRRRRCLLPFSAATVVVVPLC